MCLDVKVLNDDNQEIKLKESVDEEIENLDVNIEGNEDFVLSSQDNDYEEPEESDEDDELNLDYDDLTLDDLKDDLKIEDFNDEH